MQAGDDSDYSIGSEALMSCSNPDGTNAVMAAFAVAVAQELGRWDASRDCIMNSTSGWSESSWASQQAIKLASGSDYLGPVGKIRNARTSISSPVSRTMGLLPLPCASTSDTPRSAARRGAFFVPTPSHPLRSPRR